MYLKAEVPFVSILYTIVSGKWAKMVLFILVRRNYQWFTCTQRIIHCSCEICYNEVFHWEIDYSYFFVWWPLILKILCFYLKNIMHMQSHVNRHSNSWISILSTIVFQDQYYMLYYSHWEGQILWLSLLLSI